MPAPVASGWSGCRVGLAPTGKAPPCHGARGWRTSFPEHALWVISRGTLIFLIVLVAFAVKLPFERLMERDALAEIEKREKAKLLREYDILEQITISSSKIEV